MAVSCPRPSCVEQKRRMEFEVSGGWKPASRTQNPCDTPAARSVRTMLMVNGSGRVQNDLSILTCLRVAFVYGIFFLVRGSAN